MNFYYFFIFSFSFILALVFDIEDRNTLNLFSSAWFFDTKLKLDSNVVWSGDLIDFNLTASLDHFKRINDNLYSASDYNKNSHVFPYKHRKTGFYLQDPIAATRPFPCDKDKFHPHHKKRQDKSMGTNLHFIGPDSFFLWRRDFSWGVLDQKHVRDRTVINREFLVDTTLHTIPLHYKSGPTLSTFGLAPAETYSQIR